MTPIFFLKGCKDIAPENLAERLIWWSIVLTYPIYIIGGLYIVGSVLSWLLLLILLIKILGTENAQERPSIHWSLWVWIVAMLVMEVALLVGHTNFNFGTAQIIKSSIGWAKGWAALALYPLAGCLRIRPQLLYRAGCIFAMHSIFWFVLCTVAFALKIPPPSGGEGLVYVSPLKALGGSGESFFQLTMYEIDPESGASRFRFFAPWAPAGGMVANTYLVMAIRERKLSWKLLGLLGTFLIAVGTKSRLGQLGYLVIPPITFFLSRASRPWMLFGLSGVSYVMGFVFPTLKTALENFYRDFKGQRAGSSAVRAALKEIAFYRWYKEAPIWGHGTVERGPKLVEHMPIGSHHTWAGLLFAKGIVGFLAFLVPVIVTLGVLLQKAWDQRHEHASAGIGIMVMVLLYTFAENMETLIYLYWPGAILLGIALNEPAQPRASPPQPPGPGLLEPAAGRPAAA
ncbi:O-antigen ligase family protein [Synechococcus sp. RSCCF101]|uniref:O-antigen ligase family protein n=1 Tax=Synechococcus sp. RSCCF101 TaxID=2511069 RepID=UPI001783FF7E|nr:O-antigen ligase family protein [Synechococcus sp. RSCCF101]